MFYWKCKSLFVECAYVWMLMCDFRILIIKLNSVHQKLALQNFFFSISSFFLLTIPVENMSEAVDQKNLQKDPVTGEMISKS